MFHGILGSRSSKYHTRLRKTKVAYTSTWECVRVVTLVKGLDNDSDDADDDIDDSGGVECTVDHTALMMCG